MKKHTVSTLPKSNRYKEIKEALDIIINEEEQEAHQVGLREKLNAQSNNKRNLNHNQSMPAARRHSTKKGHGHSLSVTSPLMRAGSRISALQARHNSGFKPAYNKKKVLD